MRQRKIENIKPKERNGAVWQRRKEKIGMSERKVLSGIRKRNIKGNEKERRGETRTERQGEERVMGRRDAE